MSSPDRYYHSILDAMPLPVFVVDDDVRVVDCNAAATAFAAAERAQLLRRRGGEVLHCLHALDVAEGCGRGPHCGTCAIRGSVKSAFSGEAVSRRRMRAELGTRESLTEVDLLVTSVPFAFEGRQLALLIFEDVTELSALRGIIPICAQCKKIRDDQAYWSHVETYFTRHLGVDFSHGLCPECAKALYPDFSSDAP